MPSTYAVYPPAYMAVGVPATFTIVVTGAVPSNFTISLFILNGTASVSPVPVGAGGVATFTVTAVQGGEVVLIYTNNGSLANPNGQTIISYNALSLAMASASYDGNVTLSIPFGGAIGALSPGSGITGLSATVNGRAASFAAITSAGQTVTAVFANPTGTAAILLSLAAGTGSNLTDSALNGAVGQTAFPVAMPAPPVLLQISAVSGQILYALFQNSDGKYFNTASAAYETYSAGNWTSYAVAINEIVIGSGSYFGNIPTSLPPGPVILIPIYVQAGASPASTDIQLGVSTSGLNGLCLVLDWSGTAINSLSPLRPAEGTRVADVPAVQDSLKNAQDILACLYAARLKMAAGAGLQSVTVDGQQTAFQSPQQVDRAIQWWEKKVALLSGRRKRTNVINMGYF